VTNSNLNVCGLSFAGLPEKRPWMEGGPRQLEHKKVRLAAARHIKMRTKCLKCRQRLQDSYPFNYKITETNREDNISKTSPQDDIAEATPLLSRSWAALRLSRASLALTYVYRSTAEIYRTKRVCVV
jgi:hypothetical protein